MGEIGEMGEMGEMGPSQVRSSQGSAREAALSDARALVGAGAMDGPEVVAAPRGAIPEGVPRAGTGPVSQGGGGGGGGADKVQEPGGAEQQQQEEERHLAAVRIQRAARRRQHSRHTALRTAHDSADEADRVAAAVVRPRPFVEPLCMPLPRRGDPIRSTLSPLASGFSLLAAVLG
eukprot:COSAG01_NODE_1142_length_11533_cov_9.907381_8_plen_176_part_00